MESEQWETVRAILILLGGLATGVVTSRTTRKSQKESSQITMASDLINQVQEERDHAVKERDEANAVIRSLGEVSTKREGMWRSYTRRLRAQIYKLGGEPIDPSDDLGV